MDLQEIANHIATAEASLLSGHSDFHIGQLLCRVARINGKVCYFYRTLYPVQAESADHLASIAFAVQQPIAWEPQFSVRDPVAAHYA